MESTSCGEECAFVRSGLCNHEKKCPNYIETWWVTGEKQEPRMIKDCSPKRIILQQQLLQTRVEQLTEALLSSRNEYNQLSNYLKTLVEMSKAVLKEGCKQIPQENQNGQIVYSGTRHDVPN
jgi:hypothetical protein